MSALLKPPSNPNHGRPRSQPVRRKQVVAHQPASDTINVAVMINFGGGASSKPCRFKWRASISEEIALAEVFRKLPDADLSRVSEIHMTQAPRGNIRIAWLDDEPFGNYYVNQDLYGENGIMNHGLSNIDLSYNADDIDVGPETVAGYQQDVRRSSTDDRVGPGTRYDPDDISYQRGPPPPAPTHPAFMTPQRL